jgi:hypothetical protein
LLATGVAVPLKVTWTVELAG